MENLHINQTSSASQKLKLSQHQFGLACVVRFLRHGLLVLNKFSNPTHIIDAEIITSIIRGDMVIYKGCELEHWREPFEGNNHAQVFLHYNNIDGPFGTQNKFDKRPLLGIPK